MSGQSNSGRRVQLPPAEVIDALLKPLVDRAGAGRSRRGATCRRCRSCSPPCANTSGSVGRPGRRNVRPAVTDVAPLRSAARPVSSCPRVGLHIGQTWKSVSRTDSPGEGVEVRRLQDRVAGEREVAQPLVVGHDDQDVRLRGCHQRRTSWRSAASQAGGQQVSSIGSNHVRLQRCTNNTVWPVANVVQAREPTRLSQCGGAVNIAACPPRLVPWLPALLRSSDTNSSRLIMWRSRTFRRLCLRSCAHADGREWSSGGSGARFLGRTAADPADGAGRCAGDVPGAAGLPHRAGGRRAARGQPRGGLLRRARPAVRRRDARLLRAGQGVPRHRPAAGRRRQDGRFEKSTVFADKLSWPTAVIC